MTIMSLNTDIIHPSWQPLIQQALQQVSSSYLSKLTHHNNWLPGANAIYSAFSLPLNQTKYILFGESPYPRTQSANGYAFWDAAVDGLWSEKGLSKQVNRATSLRNIIKMLLVAEQQLTNNTSQAAIAKINKSNYVQDINGLFTNLLNAGFLLLNASLVLSEQQVQQDANAWQPFLRSLLQQLASIQPNLKLILLGKIAKQIQALAPKQFKQIIAEHPYNLSFIHNNTIIDFFRPHHLLTKPQCARI